MDISRRTLLQGMACAPVAPILSQLGWEAEQKPSNLFRDPDAVECPAGHVYFLDNEWHVVWTGTKWRPLTRKGSLA